MIYPRRYLQEPRKRMAYEEACDFIAVYGIPRQQWDYKRHGLDRTEMKAVWDMAMTDMNGKSGVDVVYVYDRRRRTR